MPENPDSDIYQKLTDISNLNYDAKLNRLKIDIPKSTNIGYQILGQHADSPRRNKVAMIYEDIDGHVSKHTYHELHQRAIQFAVRLSEFGVGRGDTVAIHTGQRPETIVAHVATYYLGAIALTLSQLYGPDTIEHILDHSNCHLLITCLLYTSDAADE